MLQGSTSLQSPKRVRAEVEASGNTRAGGWPICMDELEGGQSAWMRTQLAGQLSRGGLGNTV
jgi:hypothetical protein